jgi:hypothetical protein
MNKTLLSYALAIAGSVGGLLSGDITTIDISKANTTQKLEQKLGYNFSKENQPYSAEKELHYSIYARKALFGPIRAKASGSMVLSSDIDNETLSLKAKSDIAIRVPLFNDDSSVNLESRVRLSDFKTLSSSYTRDSNSDPSKYSTTKDTPVPKDAESYLNVDPISFMYLVRNRDFKLGLGETIPVLCTYQDKISEGSLSRIQFSPKPNTLLVGCDKYTLKMPGQKLAQVDVYVKQDSTLPVQIVQHLMYGKFRATCTLRSVEYKDGQIRNVYK